MSAMNFQFRGSRSKPSPPLFHSSTQRSHSLLLPQPLQKATPAGRAGRMWQCWLLETLTGKDGCMGLRMEQDSKLLSPSSLSLDRMTYKNLFQLVLFHSSVGSYGLYCRAVCWSVSGVQKQKMRSIFLGLVQKNVILSISSVWHQT